MKLLVSFIVLGLSALSFPTMAVAFKDNYQCTSVAETTIGYSPRSAKIESNAGPVKSPATVRISGVTSDRPILHAQQTVPLIKLAETNHVAWFAETAPARTIINWTLFDNDKNRPPALISTKSYNFFGAVSFTAFYKCK